MAYDEYLADRIKQVLIEKNAPYAEKKMMGGMAFMVDDKMCVGVIDSKLTARLDPEVYDEALNKKGCHAMDFTGRPMKGWVFVEPEGVDMEKDLAYWIQLALEYNPKAKSSKKKK